MSRMDVSPAFMELTVQGEGDLYQERVSAREEPWLRNTGHWEMGGEGKEASGTGLQCSVSGEVNWD